MSGEQHRENERSRLFFFSPEKIRELRAMPKNELEQYLTMLTMRESQIPHKPIQVTGMITKGRPSAQTFANDERMKVPEPSSGMLLIIGFATLALRRRT